MHFQHQGSKVIFVLSCAVKGICIWSQGFASGSEKEGLSRGLRGRAASLDRGQPPTAAWYKQK